MALQVTFEKGGDRIVARSPISLHWCSVRDTYGLELRQDNDYMNDYKLETQLELTGSKHRGRALGLVVGDKLRRLEPPAQFPIELRHEFIDSDRIKARIENDQFSAAIDLWSGLPWRLGRNGRDLKLDVFKRDDLTSIWSVGLNLHLSLVFRAPEHNAAPLEFVRGMPGVYSSQFESNRRRH